MGFFVAAFWVVVILFLVRWMFPGLLAGERSLESGADREEISRLRQEVDRLSSQVERLLDEQSFMVRMLSDRDRRRLRERGGGDEEDQP